MQGQSEVARLRARIEEEYIACQNGLHGLTSGTTRHDFITRKMEQMMVHAEELKKLVGIEEVVQALQQLGK